MSFLSFCKSKDNSSKRRIQLLKNNIWVLAIYRRGASPYSFIVELSNYTLLVIWEWSLSRVLTLPQVHVAKGFDSVKLLLNIFWSSFNFSFFRLKLLMLSWLIFLIFEWYYKIRLTIFFKSPVLLKIEDIDYLCFGRRINTNYSVSLSS